MNPQTVVGEYRTYSDRTATHDHPFAQFILPLQGQLLIETSQHHLELDTAHLFFLPPHCQHTFCSKNTNQFLVLDIPERFLLSNLDQTMGNGFSVVVDERWNAVRSLFVSEVQQAELAETDLTQLFQYAYGLLQRDYRQTQPASPRSIEFIHNHLHQPIYLNQLAQLEGYTLTYFCDWFKKQTGMTPNAYLQSLRLQRAKTLLADTDWSISHIAQQVGYDHPASLTRLFRQCEQITPIAYRHHIRKMARS
ncbi:helix-turn-helix transcriptional regulator [Egbenema bharatensis]|uniref:helix-turn-helix transcriptional regulator n=1 Tax=Egbenema bharatensis TaxID=3463334 RepID=UPI003A853645